MRLTFESSLMPVKKMVPHHLEPLTHTLLVPPFLQSSSNPILPGQYTQPFIREKLRSLDESQRCLLILKGGGALCAHHLNSINLIRQEMSSRNCLCVRWTRPKDAWRESGMAALISQVSSNQKEKREKKEHQYYLRQQGLSVSPFPAL